MRKLLFITLVIIAGMFFITSCASVPAFLQNANGEPSLIKLIALALLAIYEIVVRLIPTVVNYSIINWIIKILKTISDTLNNES